MNKNWVCDNFAVSIHFSIERLVLYVISNLTGLRVFCCRIVARRLTWPSLNTSDMRRLSKYQALSLLSIARSNKARSRRCSSIFKQWRIDHICFNDSGSFCPKSLPLIQGFLLVARFLGLNKLGSFRVTRALTMSGERPLFPDRNRSHAKIRLI